MLLVFSLLFFNSPPLPADTEAAYKHFKKDGYEPYCLVDYTTKEVHCIYKTREECTKNYNEQHAQICFLRKSLKLGDDK